MSLKNKKIRAIITSEVPLNLEYYKKEITKKEIIKLEQLQYQEWLFDYVVEEKILIVDENNSDTFQEWWDKTIMSVGALRGIPMQEFKDLFKRAFNHE